MSLAITILLLTGHLLGNAVDGVDEEHLSHVKREGEPPTEEESKSEIFCIMSRRVKHSPDTVDSINHTEVQIQTKLDPTTL